MIKLNITVINSKAGTAFISAEAVHLETLHSMASSNLTSC